MRVRTDDSGAPDIDERTIASAMAPSDSSRRSGAHAVAGSAPRSSAATTGSTDARPGSPTAAHTAVSAGRIGEPAAIVAASRSAISGACAVSLARRARVDRGSSKPTTRGTTMTAAMASRMPVPPPTRTRPLMATAAVATDEADGSALRAVPTAPTSRGNRAVTRGSPPLGNHIHVPTATSAAAMTITAVARPTQRYARSTQRQGRSAPRRRSSTGRPALLSAATRVDPNRA